MALNKQNLVVPTSEQARENGRKGGIASQKAQKQRKLMREFAQEILEMPMSAGKVKEIHNLADVRGANITVQQAILLAMAKKAMKGDRGAAEFVRDTAGQTVASSVNLNVDRSEKLADIVQQLENGGLDE